MLNPKRLALLIRKQAVENYRFYLMTMALFIGVLSCLYALNYPVLKYGIGFQRAFFIASLLMSGCVFTNLIVKELHEKTKAIWFLMLPASALEKLLNIFFYAVVLFVPLHLLLFYTVDFSFVSVYNANHPANPAARVYDLSANSMDTKAAYFVFMVSQAIVLVGSIYFERYSLVKSVLGVFGFFFILFYLNRLVAGIMVAGEIANAVPFHDFTVITNEAAAEKITAQLPDSMEKAFGFAAKFLLTPFLWMVAYFKLKEREV